MTLDQRELVSSAGAYVSDELSLNHRAAVTAGIRADGVRFEVKDRLITSTNPNDSGRRTMNAISPVIGAVFRIAPLHSPYANISGAFETPTATELGNRADGTAGINPDLSPQKSVTSEVGAKGYVGARVRYDIAVFSTRVTDELVPFEIPNSNGRRYFRNAGRTTRRGGEAGGEIARGPFALTAAYSYSAFRFSSYRTGALVYDGNAIPGVPKHHWQAALKFSDEMGFAVLENEGATMLYVDDANTMKGPGYSVGNFRLGTAGFLKKRVSVSVGVQNIFDRHYAASVAVNAARSKFFEPAATRSFFVGAAVSSAR